MSVKEILTVASEAAEEAGHYLRSHFGEQSEVIVKGDRNLATSRDVEAEKMILARIRAAFPDHGVIGEEGGADESDRDYLWIIDPLDGTHNYIRGLNCYGVSIGVLYKGDFVAGVVHMPFDEELYLGEIGSGATKNGQPIRVAPTANLKEASLTFDSSIRYFPETMLAVLGDLSAECFNIRMTGSSVRQLTWVADGVTDCAIEFNDSCWDFAGSVAIIEAAGGRCTTLRGEKLTHHHKGYIMSNGVLHDGFIGLVKRHLSADFSR